ncbi:hypothetical protein HUU05_05825, partial [candidate division KSB1 bacterium]|nr:hypothetical protein [candidate division KSB1 bacterium]
MSPRLKIFSCATVVLLLTVGNVASQALRSGPQVLSFFSEVDDAEQPYGLY